MITSYASVQVVHVAAQLGLADLLADGPRSVDELATITGTHAPTLARPVRALAALGIVAEAGAGRIELTPLGVRLRPNVPGSVRDIVLFRVRAWLWRA
jgi:predicted transcriptional regulator